MSPGSGASGATKAACGRASARAGAVRSGPSHRPRAHAAARRAAAPRHRPSGRETRSIQLRHPGLAPAASSPANRGGVMAANAAITTRFAPAPTGLLHLGHALSARRLPPRRAGGELPAAHRGYRPDALPPGVQRGDPRRSRLARPRLGWPGPHPVPAHGRLRRGARAAGGAGLLYPCFCTRGESRASRRPASPARPGWPALPRHLPPPVAAGPGGSASPAATPLRPAARHGGGLAAAPPA